MNYSIDKNSRNILIRATNWLGDAVMITPAIARIRESFPKARITLLANPLVGQLFQGSPWVDRVMVFDRKRTHAGVMGRWRLAREVRREAFDAAIIFPNSFDAAFVPWLAGIPVRVGKVSDGRGLLLTGRYRPQEQVPPCHEVEYYLDLVRHFGITGQATAPRLFTTPEEDRAAAEFLAGHGIGADDILLGINPGAAYGSAKRWYPARFAQVAQELAQAWGARVVIFGGPDETEIAADIEAGLGPEQCLNVAGRTSVRQLLALIKRCNFFVTNDSGPMHMAAALGVPLVAIFGSTDHSTTSPYTEQALIVRKDVACAPCKLRECPTDHRCMTAVTAEDVVSAAQSLYKGVPKQHEDI